jgi:hypothetical protein
MFGPSCKTNPICLNYPRYLKCRLAIAADVRCDVASSVADDGGRHCRPLRREGRIVNPTRDYGLKDRSIPLDRIGDL